MTRRKEAPPGRAMPQAARESGKRREHLNTRISDQKQVFRNRIALARQSGAVDGWAWPLPQTENPPPEVNSGGRQR